MTQNMPKLCILELAGGLVEHFWPLVTLVWTLAGILVGLGLSWFWTGLGLGLVLDFGWLDLVFGFWLGFGWACT